MLRLQQNFRSRPAILRFVNRVFAELIEASEEADQTAYEPIDPPPGLSDEPSVVGLRFAAPSAASGDDLLRSRGRRSRHLRGRGGPGKPGRAGPRDRRDTRPAGPGTSWS